MGAVFKEKVNGFIAKLAALFVLASARANYLVRSDAFDDAGKAVTNLQTKLVTLAEVIFPLAIVICAVSMFFTRDQKKFDLEKHILIGCCLAMALVVLVGKGNLVATIKGLF